jgi:RAD3-like DEAD/DEAH box helicase
VSSAVRVLTAVPPQCELRALVERRFAPPKADTGTRQDRLGSGAINRGVIVNVFELDQALVNDYERFARSFTEIRARDIREEVQSIYESDRFWPEPLVSINPRFESGESIDRLVRASTLNEATAHVFAIDGKPLSLYRHQAQAVAKATAGHSFVVTTGTGSGKSLCFFIPIIDAAIRGRLAGEPKRTRAIVIYPMNALANSQREEIDKFIGQSGLPTICGRHLRVTPGRRAKTNASRSRKQSPTSCSPIS